MLGIGSGLQPGAALGPGKLLEANVKVLCTETAYAARCPGEIGQKLCFPGTAFGPATNRFKTPASFQIVTLKTAQTGLTDMLGTCWQKSGLARLKLNSPKPK